MSGALVHIHGFRMDFGDKTVIRDLSFDVQRGETFGFLGSNGSGKTTTIRGLLGIYQPTAGTLHINGRQSRVTEMILTTLNPTTLISGKVLALFAVGAVQILVFASPFIIGYLFFREQVSIPDVDLTALVFEPVPMIIGFLLLVGGFTLFTTTLVAIAAVMPTAKEAGNFISVMMALIVVPFYAISLIFSNPQALIVQLFTYFPFSSPVTAMLRNGLGSLSTTEAAVVIAILFIGSGLMFRLAVRLFQYGSIAYTTKVNIKTALSNGKKAAPPVTTSTQ